MFPQRLPVLALSLMHIAVCLRVASAAEAAWPAGYEVAEDSESPNGRYGVILPSREKAIEGNNDSFPNSFADLKTHRSRGVIRGVDYFQGQNHRGLSVAWAGDSSWCVLQYEARFGFDTISVIEPRGTTFTQTDIGRQIQKSLDAIIARQVRDGSAEGCANAHFRPQPGGRLLVLATANDNPKCIGDQPTHCAFFHGRFDLAAGKWVRSDARKITRNEENDLESALITGIDDGRTFSSETDKLRSLDERLNEVYRALRIILPAERFAAVKKEQIVWLKRLEASRSVATKYELIAARVKDLRDLAW